MTASEKKMIKVLGVIMIIMALVWGRRYMNKKKPVVRGKRRQAATTSRRRTTSRRGATKKTTVRKKKQVLTPRDIPRLNDNLRLKLKQMKNPDIKEIDETEITYGTTNVFLSLDLNDKKVERLKREQKAALTGGEMMAETLYFRGVAHVNGERLAILERGDRTIPWYVKEGEILEDTEYLVQNIADGDTHITLIDKGAKRERDRIKTIPSSGIKDLEDLSFKPKTTKAPENVEAADGFEATEDDLEIIE